MSEDSNGKTSGQVGYEAYGAAGNWLTFDGWSMPRWNDLRRSADGRETQRRWEVAATSIINSFITFDGPRG